MEHTTPTDKEYKADTKKKPEVPLDTVQTKSFKVYFEQVTAV